MKQDSLFEAFLCVKCNLEPFNALLHCIFFYGLCYTQVELTDTHEECDCSNIATAPVCI